MDLPDHWRLVTENPKDLISLKDVSALNVAYETGKGVGAYTTTLRLNYLKTLRWMMQPDHLGRRLNEAGPFEGKSLKMWTFAAMMAVRIKYKAYSDSKKPWDLAHYVQKSIQNPNKAPAYKPLPLWEVCSEEESLQAYAEDAAPEEDEDQIPLVQPIHDLDIDDDLDPMKHAQMATGPLLTAWGHLLAYIESNSAEMDKPFWDELSRNIKQRPDLSQIERDRVLAEGLAHAEIIEDGTHERLAKQSVAVNDVSGNLSPPASPAGNYHYAWPLDAPTNHLT